MAEKMVKIGSDVLPNWNQNDTASPDYVRNRTHYTKKAFDDITWDGDTTGKVSVVVTAYQSYCKISDQILSVEDLIGATFHAANTGISITLTADDILPEDEGVIYIPQVNARVVLKPTVYQNLTFPNTGVYVSHMHYPTGEVIGYTDKIIARDVIHKLDPKYLPDGTPSVQTAEVGQTIAVKAVDEFGKPTEWEAVDMGGGEEYDLDVLNKEVLVGTFAEIKAKLKNAEIVKCRIRSALVNNSLEYFVTKVYYDGDDNEIEIYSINEEGVWRSYLLPDNTYSHRIIKKFQLEAT